MHWLQTTTFLPARVQPVGRGERYNNVEQQHMRLSVELYMNRNKTAACTLKPNAYKNTTVGDFGGDKPRARAERDKNQEQWLNGSRGIETRWPTSGIVDGRRDGYGGSDGAFLIETDMQSQFIVRRTKHVRSRTAESRSSQDPDFRNSLRYLMQTIWNVIETS